MMLKRTIVALSIVTLTITGVAVAQESATLVMRSGERISGQLIDMGGVGFTVRVNGQERQIPTNDVAVIEFAGGNATDADYAKIAGGQHVVVLRNGQTVEGQLYDIGGTTPLKITFKTSSGDREFSSSEIGRIVLARPSDIVATSGATNAQLSAGGAGIAVSSRNRWTPTGITVRRGETITFHTSGEVQLSTDTNDIATPDGAKSARYAPSSPLPRTLAGALIGRIGSGAPFPIGTQTAIPMPAAGELFLGVNDDELSDNHGEFRVEVIQQARRK